MPVIIELPDKNGVNHSLNDFSISARWMVKLRGNAYYFLRYRYVSLFFFSPTPISFWLQIILHAKWPIHGNTHIRLNEANNNPTDGDNSIYRYVQFISFANHFLCIERVRKIGTKWNGKNESTRQKNRIAIESEKN